MTAPATHGVSTAPTCGWAASKSCAAEAPSIQATCVVVSVPPACSFSRGDTVQVSPAFSAPSRVFSSARPPASATMSMASEAARTSPPKVRASWGDGRREAESDAACSLRASRGASASTPSVVGLTGRVKSRLVRPRARSALEKAAQSALKPSPTSLHGRAPFTAAPGHSTPSAASPAWRSTFRRVTTSGAGRAT